MTPASSAALLAATQDNATSQNLFVAARTIRADLLEEARAKAVLNLGITVSFLQAAIPAISNVTAQGLLSSLIVFLQGVRTEISETAYLHGVLATGGTTALPSAGVSTAKAAFESAKGELELNANSAAQAALPTLETLIELVGSATDYGLGVALPLLPIAAFDQALSGVLVQWRRAAFVAAWGAAQRARLEAGS
jgi:hypothetical protein